MKLVIRKEGHLFKEVDLTKDEIVLGRSKHVDVQLFDEDVSRRHVKIIHRSGKIYLEDLQSKNGTFVHGKSVTKTGIAEGETFSIGPFTISIESATLLEQKTVVEHSLLDESPSQTFIDEKSNNTKTGIKSMPSLSLSTENTGERDQSATMVEDPNEGAHDSDSFFEAIAVSPSSEVTGERNDSNFNFPKSENTKETQEPFSTGGFKTEVVEEPFTEKEYETSVKEFVKQDELSSEKSIEEFPSASDKDESPESEQFFLNRELDENVPETFQDFPNTTKIKPDAAGSSSFSLASEGSIQEDSHPIATDPLNEVAGETPEGSGAIATNFFEEAETALAPQEDEIKTFLAKESDLNSSVHNEATDEYAAPTAIEKLVERTREFSRKIPELGSYALQNLQKPKGRKFLFVISAIIVGMGVLVAMDGGKMLRRKPINPETAINNETEFEDLNRSEKKRVIEFQIDQIQKLLNSKNLAEADEKMNKLTPLAAKDADFLRFEKAFQKQRETIVAEQQRKETEMEELQQKRSKLLSSAADYIEENQLDLAEKNYQEALKLFPGDEEIQEKIQTLELLREQHERKEFARQQNFTKLNAIYNAGVEKYESGQLGQAQKLFKQLTSERDHPKYKRALEYLNKIESMTDKKVDQKVSTAKAMIQNSETLVEGYTELKKIVNQFPLRSDAKKYLADAKTKMEKKARELYAEGLAQEELAGDPTAALDLYREVLRYAPEAGSRYNQKAKEKIANLEM
jgi:pSer/pThr/pTyr-binding forkhead associated (FHA) protein